MPALDHLILSINDRAESLRFYTEVLGFEDGGERDRVPGPTGGSAVDPAPPPPPY